MIRPNPAKYLQSLHFEVKHQSDRIRNLIGDKHWLSDGIHKESLISSVLIRHLPHSFSLGTGFAIHPNSIQESSKELDITIIDKRFEAPIHSQFGFEVCFCTQLAGSLSVKSKLDKNSFTSTLDNLVSVAKLQISGHSKPWLGGIFFDDELEPSQFLNSLSNWYNNDNEINAAFNQLKEFRMFLGTTGKCLATIQNIEGSGQITSNLAIFDCPNTAFAIMIADLSADLSERAGSNDRQLNNFIWDTQYSKKIGSIPLNTPTSIS